MNTRLLESAEPHTRRCRLSRFPYSVIYSLDGDDLLVVAVAHQHRKPGYWRDRLQKRCLS